MWFWRDVERVKGDWRQHGVRVQLPDGEGAHHYRDDRGLPRQGRPQLKCTQLPPHAGQEKEISYLIWPPSFSGWQEWAPRRGGVPGGAAQVRQLWGGWEAVSVHPRGRGGQGPCGPRYRPLRHPQGGRDRPPEPQGMHRLDWGEIQLWAQAKKGLHRIKTCWYELSKYFFSHSGNKCLKTLSKDTVTSSCLQHILERGPLGMNWECCLTLSEFKLFCSDFDISFSLWMDIRAEIREIIANGSKNFNFM